jgi:hypothetical protein
MYYLPHIRPAEILIEGNSKLPIKHRSSHWGFYVLRVTWWTSTCERPDRNQQDFFSDATQTYVVPAQIKQKYTSENFIHSSIIAHLSEVQ